MLMMFWFDPNYIQSRLQKTNVRKVTEMGGYMDVDVDAAGEVSERSTLRFFSSIRGRTGS